MGLFSCRLTLLTAMLALVFWGAASCPADAITIGGPGVNLGDFRITTFKSGLNFPYGIQVLSDGSLLVATSRPNDPNNPFGFFDSVGEVVRLVDSDGDGAAESTSVLYTGLAGVLTGLAVAGDLVFVTSSATGGEQISVLRMGATPAAPLTLVGALVFTFPSGWEHTTYGLAVRQIAAQTWELFFNVGSDANNSQSTATVNLSGLTSGTLEGASIYKVTVTESGATVSVSGLTRVASGLRNATGMAFHPVSGDFYLSDNGIDGLDNPDQALSADEMNVLVATAIGGAVDDFGFPATFTAYRSGTIIGGAGVQPIATFQPIGTAESKGATQVVMAPQYFPAPVGNGMFVGFHGLLDATQGPIVANAVVFLDRGSSQYFHFISTGSGLAHPDGLATTSDSLFVADLSSTGFLGGLGTGVIYQIKAKPDLTIGALAAPSSAKRGAQISVTDTTMNQGGPAGGSQTAFYLTSAKNGAAVARLGARAIPPLAAGSRGSTGTTALKIPEKVAPGSYFIMAGTDDGAIVDERDETNNTRALPFTVSPGK